MALHDLILTQNISLSDIEYVERIINILKGGLLTTDSDGKPIVHPSGNLDDVLFSDPSTSTGLKWSPLPSFINLLSGFEASYGDCAYIDTNSIAQIANSSLNEVVPIICLDNSILADHIGRWLLYGILINSDWTWTPGKPLFVTAIGTTGNTMSHNPPSNEDNIVQTVGFAKDATTIIFRPSLVWFKRRAE